MLRTPNTIGSPASCQAANPVCATQPTITQMDSYDEPLAQLIIANSSIFANAGARAAKQVVEGR